MRIKKSLAGLLAFVMFASLACGMTDNLINKAVGDNTNTQSVPSLWSDVPQMDGLTLSELEAMPPFFKLPMRRALDNLWRRNPPGTDQGTVKIDWIGCTTLKTPHDAQALYTNAL